MQPIRDRTALVTGATSGLGFEAAAQLAEAGYGRVIVTGRTRAKAEAAKAELNERVPDGVFEVLALDNDRLRTVEAAADELAMRGGQIDTLILNAGIAPPGELRMTEDGFDSVFSSSLLGHHLFTMRLFEADVVSDEARIVIASSEASKGDMPTFQPLDVEAFADRHFDGAVRPAIDSYVRMELPAKYKPNESYATTKQFVNWWAAELAKRLPAGASVISVSPGGTPDTNADRNVSWAMRTFFMAMMRVVPGMSHSVATGARRYIEASQLGPGESGKFYATAAKGKAAGPMGPIQLEHLDRPTAQAALWKVLVAATGGVDCPKSANEEAVA